MLKFKINVYQRLKNKGHNTRTLRNDGYFGQKTIFDIKKGIVPGTKSIDTLCKLLELQPGSFLEYVPDDQNKIK